MDPEVAELQQYILALEADIMKLNNRLCNLKAEPVELQTQISVLLDMYRMLDIRVKNLEAKKQ